MPGLEVLGLEGWVPKAFDLEAFCLPAAVVVCLAGLPVLLLFSGDAAEDSSAIISSGYSNDPIIKDFKKYNFSGVIAKPFDVDELVRVIESVLADGPRILLTS